MISQAQDSWLYKKCRKVNLNGNSLLSYLAPSFLKRQEGLFIERIINETVQLNTFILDKFLSNISWLSDFTYFIFWEISNLVRLTANSSCFRYMFLEAIVQIEIDEASHVLYTRSEKGSIQVFDLGEDGQSANKVGEMSHSAISRTASQVLTYVSLYLHALSSY